MLTNSIPLKFMPNSYLKDFPVHTIFGMSSPGYAKAISSYSMKYKVFSINGDELLVIFKEVTVCPIHYTRLVGFPISKKGNIHLEKALFKKLSQLEDVTEIQLSEVDARKHGLNEAQLDFSGVDFYAIPSQAINNLNGRYRRHYQINRFKDDLVYRDATPNDIENILTLTTKWIEHKEKGEGVHSKHIFNNMFKNPQKYMLDDFKTKVLYYKGDLFAFSVYSVLHDRAYQITNILDTSDKFPKNLIQSGNRVVYYYLIHDFLDLNIDYVSFLGSINLKSNVYKNKLEVYKTYEKIYRIKIKK